MDASEAHLIGQEIGNFIGTGLADLVDMRITFESVSLCLFAIFIFFMLSQVPSYQDEDE